MVQTSRKTRIGSISITRSISNPESMKFENLYESIGKNTGNLMFTEAMFRILDGEISKIGFMFDAEWVNANYDIVVVPAANWLNKSADWDWLLQRLEKLTIPVVAIGLGLQASTQDIDAVEVSESALSLARFFAKSAGTVSVRGRFTQRWLAKMGLNDTVVTGCPSLYMNIFGDNTLPKEYLPILQTTRYAVSSQFALSQDINRIIFRMSHKYNIPLVYQSEPEEINHIVYNTSFSSLHPAAGVALSHVYGAETLAELDRFVADRGRVFFNLHEWSNFIKIYRGVIGTRLHGSILALNSGRPAVLLGHDSRTQELIEFAQIPTMNEQNLRNASSINDLISLLDSADVDVYYDRRSDNQLVMKKFLEQVGLKANADFMF